MCHRLAPVASHGARTLERAFQHSDSIRARFIVGLISAHRRSCGSLEACIRASSPIVTDRVT